MLTVRVLGTAEIYHSKERVKLGGKSLALLAYLLISGQPQPRKRLMDLLFDKAADPRRSLNWLVGDLRRRLGPAYLLTDRDAVAFDFTQDHWLDTAALVDGDVDAYRGDLLTGLHVRGAGQWTDWLHQEREKWRLRYENRLADALADRERQGQFEAVIELAGRLLELDNLREDWHRALMRAYALTGSQAAALAQYKQCRQLLRQELGVDPAPETEALLADIQAHALADPRSLLTIPVQYPPFLAESGEHDSSTIFVGRERPLAQLASLLQKAVAGQGQIAFICGGAGRGKSALLSQFARQSLAAHPDLLVAKGHGNAFAGIGDAFLPFRDVLNMMAGDVESRLATGTISLDLARRLWGALLITCEALSRYGHDLLNLLIPQADLRRRVEQALPPTFTNLAQLQKLFQRRELPSNLEQSFLFEQLTNVFKFVAERRPLLILLDDLQWADSTSISLLFHLSQRLQDSPVCLVGAFRPEEVALPRDGRPHPLTGVLAELSRRFGNIEIDLSQADDNENRTFVTTYLTQALNDYDPTVDEALFAQTGGHPLFTVELLRAMQEREHLVQAADGTWRPSPTLNWQALPARVEAVIASRLARLTPAQRAMLTAASIEGEQFSAQVAARVLQIRERDALRLLAGPLLLRHRLVRPQEEIEIDSALLSRYRFTHALFQQYVYEELSPGERRLLHGQVGEALETLYAGQVDAIAVQLAQHYLLARRKDKARTYLQMAGEQALNQYAYDEALDYSDKALALTPDADDAARYALQLQREKIFARQGQQARRSETLQALDAIVASLDDAKKRGEVALRWAQLAYVRGNFDQMKSLAQKATSLGQGHQFPLLEAEGYLTWSQALYTKYYLEEAIEKSKFALALAEQENHQNLIARCCNMLAVAFITQKNFPAGKKYNQRAHDIFEQLGDKTGVARALIHAGAEEAQHGDYFSGLSSLNKGLNILKEIGDRPREAITWGYIATCHQYLGNFTEADRCSDKGLLLLEESSMKRFVLMNLITKTTNALLMEENEKALKHCRKALKLSTELGVLVEEARCESLKGRAFTALGRYEEAFAAFNRSLAIWQKIEVSRDFQAVYPLAGLAELHLLQEEMEKALRLVDEVLPFLDRYPLLAGNPYDVYFTCYRILSAAGDPRAQQILARANRLMEKTAVTITDKRQRHTFLHSTKEIREMRQAYAKATRRDANA